MAAGILSHRPKLPSTDSYTSSASYSSFSSNDSRSSYFPDHFDGAGAQSTSRPRRTTRLRRALGSIRATLSRSASASASPCPSPSPSIRGERTWEDDAPPGVDAWFAEPYKADPLGSMWGSACGDLGHEHAPESVRAPTPCAVAHKFAFDLVPLRMAAATEHIAKRGEAYELDLELLPPPSPAYSPCAPVRRPSLPKSARSSPAVATMRNARARRECWDAPSVASCASLALEAEESEESEDLLPPLLPRVAAVLDAMHDAGHRPLARMPCSLQGEQWGPSTSVVTRPSFARRTTC